jgi:hypothetical protein
MGSRLRNPRLAEFGSSAGATWGAVGTGFRGMRKKLVLGPSMENYVIAGNLLKLNRT